jgi:hypothetical protein
VSWPWLVLLVLAAALVAAVEWPRVVGSRFGAEARKERERSKRRAKLRVVTSTDEDPESDEFIRSVQRDLDSLPTIEERDRRT